MNTMFGMDKDVEVEQNYNGIPKINRSFEIKTDLYEIKPFPKFKKRSLSPKTLIE